MNDELLTAEEVADRLRVNPDTVAVWARRRRIPALRLSRKVIRFRLPEVIAALEAATAGDRAQGQGQRRGASRVPRT
jgi:excisionase family DNA binding protein